MFTVTKDAPVGRRVIGAVLAAAWLAATLYPAWAYTGIRTPWGHNAEFHLFRTLAVADCWSAGMLVPRWVSSFSGGLGYPIFTFYGWAPYAWSALLYAAGMDLAAATNAICVTGALVMGAGAWRLGFELGGRRGAVACWAVYCFAPYQFLNLYVRTSPPEYAAGALAPWAILLVLRAVRDGGACRLVAAGVVLALLAFTHNIGAAVFWPVSAACGLAAVALRRRQCATAGVGRLAAAFAMAAAMSAHFWLPLVAMHGAVRLDATFGGDLRYDNQLVTVRQLLNPAWKYGFSPRAAEAEMSFQAGPAQLLALLLALGFGLAGRRIARGRRAGLVASGAAGLGLLFLATAHARPVWDWVVPLRLVQLPWRLLLPAVLFSAMAAAHLAGMCRRGRAAWVAPALAGLAVAASLCYCRPWNLVRITEAELRRILPRAPVTTTIVDEYRPRNGRPFGPWVPERLMVNGAEGPAPPAVWRRAGMSFPLELRSGAEVVIPVYHFPGWTAAVDGRMAPVRGNRDGLLTVSVPRGTHTLRIAWRPTALQRFADTVSLVSLAVAALGCLFGRVVRSRATPA